MFQADDDDDSDSPAGVVSFVPHSANKYPKQKKPRTASSTDQQPSAKAAQAPRTLLKAGELVHVATDVPLTAQHDMFGAVDSSTFQVTAYMQSCSALPDTPRPCHALTNACALTVTCLSCLCV
jgi:hypothetical protein